MTRGKDSGKGANDTNAQIITTDAVVASRNNWPQFFRLS